jgi:hypothetical protein
VIPAACAVDGAYFGIHIMELFISFYCLFEIYFSFVRGRSKKSDICGGNEGAGEGRRFAGRHRRLAWDA